jgi:hypothetical protein
MTRENSSRGRVVAARRAGRRNLGATSALAFAALGGAAQLGACGSSQPPSTFTGGSSSNSRSDAGSSGIIFGDGGSNTFGDAATQPFSTKNTCPNGGTTTMTGRVLDPAGKNPVFNVTVFVRDPNVPLPDPAKVPIACGCDALFPSDVLAFGTTDATGHYSIPDAAHGNGISVVVQSGKWRKVYDNISIQECAINELPDLTLPKSSAEGSLPDIAISTGGLDSLECLPIRMGVDPSEYVAGSATGGHIHIYKGFNGATTSAPAPESVSALWDSQADLDAHDVVLLSCEGHETTGGTPGLAMISDYQQFLLNYANKGGRVFASHFQYAWFTPPARGTGPFTQAPNVLATWKPGAQAVIPADNVAVNAVIDTTLAGGGMFPEGTALSTWLGAVGALTNGELPIWYSRNNVGMLTQPPSAQWAHLDPSVTQAPNATQYFSVDTPIGAAPAPDGGSSVCGRIVYSDLHVAGGPGVSIPGTTPDYPGASAAGGTVPSGCAMRDLTPQEDALEFMLFDLSSCLVPPGETTPPPPNVVPPPK